MTPLIILLIILVLILNIYLFSKAKRLSIHILSLFFLVVSSYYLLLTPSVYYFTEEWYAVNTNVKNYWDLGMLMLLVHFTFYTIGYFLFNNTRHLEYDFSSLEARSSIGYLIEKKIFFIFLILYCIIFLNTLSDGINLIDIFLGEHGGPTLGLKGGSYYLQNFADSLIALLILGFFFKIRRQYMLIMFLLAIPLFLILGFRYRIILTIFGFAIVYFYDNPIRPIVFVKSVLALLVFLYAMLLLTHNRAAIFMQEFDKISYDYKEFPYNALLHQAKGSLMDFAMYRAVDKNIVEIDYGETMIVYPIIKAIPSSFFKGGVKPYPSPQLKAIDTSISAGREVGEAVTSIGASFFAFYYPGVAIFAFATGAIIRKLQKNIGKSTYSFMTSISIVLSLFMWMTRGYMPGFIDHLAYMLIPIIILRVISLRRVYK